MEIDIYFTWSCLFLLKKKQPKTPSTLIHQPVSKPLRHKWHKWNPHNAMRPRCIMGLVKCKMLKCSQWISYHQWGVTLRNAVIQTSWEWSSKTAECTLLRTETFRQMSTIFSPGSSYSRCLSPSLHWQSHRTTYAARKWDIIYDANKCKEKVVVENLHLITVSVMLSNVKSVADLQLSSLDELSTLSLLTPSYSVFFSPSLSTFPPLTLYAINQKVIRAWWFDVRPLVLLDWHLMQLWPLILLQYNSLVFFSIFACFPRELQ